MKPDEYINEIRNLKNNFNIQQYQAKENKMEYGYKTSVTLLQSKICLMKFDCQGHWFCPFFISEKRCVEL